MRVAALYDIHGNLPALDAALAEIRRERVDLVVVGGDVVVGPDSAAAVRGLLDLEIPTRFISGNCERVVLADLAGGDISEVPAAYQADIHRASAELDARCLAAIRRWPATCQIAVDDLGDVFFCHSTARNDREVLTAETPETEVATMFEGVEAAIVVCGHTHVQYDRRAAGRRIVNAGSVGMPFAPPPGAHWLMIGPDIDLRQTPYGRHD